MGWRDGRASATEQEAYRHHVEKEQEEYNWHHVDVEEYTLDHVDVEEEECK